MKVFTAILVYPFFCGLIIGPWLGEKMRCGEKTPTVYEMLGIAAAMPIGIGAFLTSGKTPEKPICEDTSISN